MYKEPAAGNHLLADVLLKQGASGVITSDIATYDREHTFLLDFLSEDAVCPVDPAEFDAIYTNPPYGIQNRDAVRFARLALDRCPGIVALLLTAKFDFGSTRVDLFRDNPRFMAKIALVDRIQWFEGDSTGTEDHAWYIWGRAGARHHPTIWYEGRERNAKIQDLQVAA